MELQDASSGRAAGVSVGASAVQQPSTKGAKPVVCLGFNTSGTDRLRLNALSTHASNTDKNGNRIYQFVAVSHIVNLAASAIDDSDDVEYAHLDCNFKNVRGFQTICERYPSAEHVMLDHYWCQCNYYFATYGVNWLDKILVAFKQMTNLQSVCLPICAWDDSMGAMLSNTIALKKLFDQGLAWVTVSLDWCKKYHPLFLSTFFFRSSGSLQASSTDTTHYVRDQEAVIIFFARKHPPTDIFKRWSGSNYCPLGRHKSVCQCKLDEGNEDGTAPPPATLSNPGAWASSASSSSASAPSWSAAPAFASTRRAAEECPALSDVINGSSSDEHAAAHCQWCGSAACLDVPSSPPSCAAMVLPNPGVDEQGNSRMEVCTCCLADAADLKDIHQTLVFCENQSCNRTFCWTCLDITNPETDLPGANAPRTAAHGKWFCGCCDTLIPSMVLTVDCITRTAAMFPHHNCWDIPEEIFELAADPPPPNCPGYRRFPRGKGLLVRSKAKKKINKQHTGLLPNCPVRIDNLPWNPAPKVTDLVEDIGDDEADDDAGVLNPAAFRHRFAPAPLASPVAAASSTPHAGSPSSPPRAVDAAPPAGAHVPDRHSRGRKPSKVRRAAATTGSSAAADSDTGAAPAGSESSASVAASAYRFDERVLAIPLDQLRRDLEDTGFNIDICVVCCQSSDAVGGDLVACDGCKRSFCCQCLGVAGPDKLPDPWKCGNCRIPIADDVVRANRSERLFVPVPLGAVTGERPPPACPAGKAIPKTKAQCVQSTAGEVPRARAQAARAVSDAASSASADSRDSTSSASTVPVAPTAQTCSDAAPQASRFEKLVGLRNGAVRPGAAGSTTSASGSPASPLGAAASAHPSAPAGSTASAASLQATAKRNVSAADVKRCILSRKLCGALTDGGDLRSFVSSYLNQVKIDRYANIPGVRWILGAYDVSLPFSAGGETHYCVVKDVPQSAEAVLVREVLVVGMVRFGITQADAHSSSSMSLAQLLPSAHPAIQLALDEFEVTTGAVPPGLSSSQFSNSDVDLSEKRVRNEAGMPASEADDAVTAAADGEQLHCLCNLPENLLVGDPTFNGYAQCNTCNGWFHPACIGYTWDYARRKAKAGTFKCNGCRQLPFKPPLLNSRYELQLRSRGVSPAAERTHAAGANEPSVPSTSSGAAHSSSSHSLSSVPSSYASAGNLYAATGADDVLPAATSSHHPPALVTAPESQKRYKSAASESSASTDTEDAIPIVRRGDGVVAGASTRLGLHQTDRHAQTPSSPSSSDVSMLECDDAAASGAATNTSTGSKKRQADEMTTVISPALSPSSSSQYDALLAEGGIEPQPKQQKVAVVVSSSSADDDGVIDLTQGSPTSAPSASGFDDEGDIVVVRDGDDDDEAGTAPDSDTAASSPGAGAAPQAVERGEPSRVEYTAVPAVHVHPAVVEAHGASSSAGDVHVPAHPSGGAPSSQAASSEQSSSIGSHSSAKDRGSGVSRGGGTAVGAAAGGAGGAAASAAGGGRRSGRGDSKRWEVGMSKYECVTAVPDWHPDAGDWDWKDKSGWVRFKSRAAAEAAYERHLQIAGSGKIRLGYPGDAEAARLDAAIARHGAAGGTEAADAAAGT